MIDLEIWRKAWALLDARERRQAWMVLTISIVAALTSALMVGSVLPFLSVLAEPERIRTVPALAWIYDTFGFQSDYRYLVALGLFVLVVITLTSSVQVLKTWVIARFSMMRIHSISYRLLAAYLRQPYEFFLNRHTGEMSTRILAETQQLVQHLLRPAAETIAAMFTVGAIVTMLFWLEPVVALVSFVCVGGVYAAIYWFSRRALRRLGVVRAETNSLRFRITNEALVGIKDIKLLGKEEPYLSSFAEPSRTMSHSMAMVQVVSLVPKYALEAIAFGGIIMLCLIVIDPVTISSSDALGDLLPLLGLFAFAGQRMMPELQKLYQSLAHLQAGAAAVSIVYDDLVKTQSRRSFDPSEVSCLSMAKQLDLVGLTYQYPNSQDAGVREINLRIHAGEKIGIIGGTGAGKTTLADLILGLLSPTEGDIIADGVVVNEANVRAWQRCVGYVPQDIFLTDSSVAENIALGVPRKEIDRNRVENAAKTARFDTFVQESLPDGYDTAIGERGVRLSGGQRQRIGIARALYHDAELIVFDEATSALDNATESEVMSSIEGLPGDKTVVMIAHRLSTVQACDKIIVMEKGKVVGFDTWEVLLKQNTVCQRLASGTHPAEFQSAETELGTSR